MSNRAIDNVLFDERINKNWHMTFAERAGLLYVLQRAKPELSIEIGTFLGGSLRPISSYSNRVITFDIDANQHRDTSLFTNVTYVTGDSGETLPREIENIRVSEAELNFILIDGSHETDGVLADINSCLRYEPKNKPTYILMHDSSNPKVRDGIMNASWASNPHVHGIDIDFVPGLLYDRSDIKDQIWGGLALAVLLPQRRSGNIDVTASFEYSRRKLLRE